MVLLLPILGFIIAAFAVVILGHASKPRPPRDGTIGPWCYFCRYSLDGLAPTVSCPECGRARVDWISAADRNAPPGGWGLTAAIASIVSHAHVYVFWIFYRPGLELFAIAFFIIFIDATLIAAVIAALARSATRCITIGALAVFLATHILADVAVGGSMLVWPPGEYQTISYAAIPAFGMLLAPYAFTLFALIAAVIITMSRRDRK